MPCEKAMARAYRRQPYCHRCDFNSRQTPNTCGIPNYNSPVRFLLAESPLTIPTQCVVAEQLCDSKVATYEPPVINLVTLQTQGEDCRRPCASLRRPCCGILKLGVF